MILRSIRWRMQLWHSLLLVAVLGGFGVAAYQLQRRSELRRVDHDLEQLVAMMETTLVRRPPPRRDGPPEGGPPDGRPDDRRPGGRPDPPDFRDGEGPPPGPRGFRLPPDKAVLFNGTGADALYYVVWNRHGEELARSTNAPVYVPRPDRPEGEQAPRSFLRTRNPWREACRITPPGERLLAGRSLDSEHAALRELAWWLTGLGVTVLILGFAGGWRIASSVLKPIGDISAAATRIAEGDLSQRVTTRDTDSEIGQLVGVLNSTFARLEASFVQQARFTADAAHELRTPISVMLTQTQSALSRERSTAEYKETLEACQRASQRMRRLVESLLELARLDAGQEPMRPRRLDLAETARDCAELLRALAAEKAITMHLEVSPAECVGDPDRLAQVVTNLVANAIHYNRDGGEVRVITRKEGVQVSLIVSDTGQGIGAEDLPHIFERFYRADKARSGAAGRSGLGLAIVQAIVEAHGGTINVVSEPGKGTTFRVKLGELTETGKSQ